VERWYDDHKITCWINTHAQSIDTTEQKIKLATGETLEYDRLILATGSRSYIPPLEGFGIPGCFPLRESEDALAIRNYVQIHHCKRAIIAGGGLLGLEAAYALHKLGLEVTVLERGKWPLQRQLNPKGGSILQAYLHGLGLNILTESEAKTILPGTHNRLDQILLQNGTELSCDILLMCAGVRPNIELAQNSGIKVQKGVVVDASMQTSLTHVYAVGDVAEYQSQIHGLWQVAVEQAEVAAHHAMGNLKEYKEHVPTTMLKVIGAEVTSIGRVQRLSQSDLVIEPQEQDENKYRMLLVSENILCGAILIGYPTEGALVSQAVKNKTNVQSVVKDLENGNFKILENLVSN